MKNKEKHFPRSDIFKDVPQGQNLTPSLFIFLVSFLYVLFYITFRIILDDRSVYLSDIIHRIIAVRQFPIRNPRRTTFLVSSVCVFKGKKKGSVQKQASFARYQRHVCPWSFIHFFTAHSSFRVKIGKKKRKGKRNLCKKKEEKRERKREKRRRKRFTKKWKRDERSFPCGEGCSLFYFLFYTI